MCRGEGGLCGCVGVYVEGGDCVCACVGGEGGGGLCGFVCVCMCMCVCMTDEYVCSMFACMRTCM